MDLPMYNLLKHTGLGQYSMVILIKDKGDSFNVKGSGNLLQLKNETGQNITYVYLISH